MQAHIIHVVVVVAERAIVPVFPCSSTVAHQMLYQGGRKVHFQGFVIDFYEIGILAPYFHISLHFHNTSLDIQNTVISSAVVVWMC